VSDATAKKEERRKFQAIKGTRDILPPETALWNRVEQTAHEVFTTFGYGEIRLPIFEATELFARSIGLDSDVVSKEMYTFENRPAHYSPVILTGEDLRPDAENMLELLEVAEYKITEPNEKKKRQIVSLAHEIIAIASRLNPSQRLEMPEQAVVDMTAAMYRLYRELEFANSLSLRPEATASVCRAYIEHNMQQLPQPVKLYYMGPMFRRERPQKGRYRQFYQIGAEILGGSDAPGIDAEVIEMLMTFFDKCGLQGATLYINSIGHNAENCRRGYVELLRSELQKVRERLGEDSKRRIDTNPLRVLDSKLESEQAIIATLPHIADHLCDECKTHYAEVKRQLQVRGVLYQENWRLVRGLDYYMRTTFEITAPGLGSQNAVCGGGRYDGLVELLGGPPTKGIGFAIGEDRLILSLQERAKSEGPNSPLATRHSPLLYIAWMGEKAYATAIRAAKDLRNAGFSVELPPLEQKFGKALGQADKLGAKYALILGDNEVSEALWTLKTLADGTQQKFTESDLLEFLRQQEKVSS
jgi:histidyl-tRNA synthetase